MPAAQPNPGKPISEKPAPIFQLLSILEEYPDKFFGWRERGNTQRAAGFDLLHPPDDLFAGSRKALFTDFAP